MLQIVSLIRMDVEDERGMPFMVACTGGSAGLFYRVTVQRRGSTIVEIWK